MKNNFPHELAPLSPDLKFNESLWDVQKDTLQRTRLLHFQYNILTKKCMHLYRNVYFILFFGK